MVVIQIVSYGTVFNDICSGNHWEKLIYVNVGQSKCNRLIDSSAACSQKCIKCYFHFPEHNFKSPSNVAKSIPIGSFLWFSDGCEKDVAVTDCARLLPYMSVLGMYVR